MADTYRIPPFRADLPIVDLSRGDPTREFLVHYLTMRDKLSTLDGISLLTGTGFIVGTAAGTYAVRNMTGTTNQVFISNGSGVLGSPVFSLPQDINTDADVIFDTATIDALHVLSSGTAFDLILAIVEAITADRTLTISVGNADRSITLSGNPTLADWFDQNVKQSASPTYVGITVSGLTASQIVAMDSNKALSSVSDLTGYLPSTVLRTDTAVCADNEVLCYENEVVTYV